MAVWRCPHCATPQPETSRCWVCRRSTTSCATCRHFRRGVAGRLGWCGRDRRHPALTGLEMRSCWTAAPLPSEPGTREPVPVGPGLREATPSRRTFVPVDTLERAPVRFASPGGPTTADEPPAEPRSIRPMTGGGRRIPGTWWLWGDPDPWPDT